MALVPGWSTRLIYAYVKEQGKQEEATLCETLIAIPSP